MRSQAEEVQEVPLLGVGGRVAEERQAGRTKKDGAGRGGQGWMKTQGGCRGLFNSSVVHQSDF